MTSKDTNFALVGIRLGASNIVVAYFKEGRSETVVNELGDRVTPTFITFNDGNDTSIGLPSKQGLVRNQQNTIIWSPHFLEKHDDNDVLLRYYNQKSPITVNENENRIEFSVTIDGKAKLIHLENVITNLLKYVQQLVVSVTGSRDVQAVLSVPYKMTHTVNQNLIRTCMKKSGIELHSIISDACSACMAYELDKDGGHTESNVLVYRLGGSTYECSILRTIGGCFQTIASVDGFENSGDVFTDLLTDLIAEEFQKKNKSDPRLSSRSLLKLRACSEQAKHILSTTAGTQCSIDALYDGIDLDCNISRLRFEGVTNNLINDCLKPIDIVLEKAKLQADDIKLIVLCGGGTKVPKLRDAIQDKLASADMLSSINGDEVIALGAARQCYIENKYAKVQLSTDNDTQYERVGVRYFRSHLIANGDEKNEISDSDVDDNDEDDEKENDQLDIDWTKHEAFLRKLDLSEWKDQDHYKVLGLAKLRYKATQKQVRNAHKQMILRYHPDKSKRIESERFSLITHAFELLSNPALRRSYDSVDPKFDDAIPNPTASDNFYETFGPVFERNARWSIHQHVPLLGNDETSFEQVNKFYRFWYDFSSWREYSYLDEEDKSQGQDRDERRYIEKLNRVERQKRKKTEMTRLRNLVDRAYALDPRIKKQKKDEQQRKDDEKLRRKQENDRKRQEQKQREIDEAKRIADEKQRIEDETKRKQDEVKREKEAQKKLIKKEKKQLRDLCKEANYFNDSASANLKQVEQIETLIEYLPVDDLKNLNEKLKEENADQRSIVLAEVKKMDEQMQQSRLELSQQSASSSSTNSTSNSTSKIKWTTDEIELLVKALRIYPAGVQNRWLVVQEYLKRSGGNPNRSAQDIMQKAKDVASGKKEVEETISSLDHIALNSHKQSTLIENQAKLNQLTLTERDPDVPTIPWTVDEQRIFEQALRTYPAALGASRWDQIAECLPSRSKKECLERYKELARMVQAKKSTTKS